MDIIYTINVVINGYDMLVDEIDDYAEAISKMDTLQIEIGKNSKGFIRYQNSDNNVHLLRADRIDHVYMEVLEDDEDGDQPKVEQPTSPEPVSV